MTAVDSIEIADGRDRSFQALRHGIAIAADREGGMVRLRGLIAKHRNRVYLKRLQGQG